MDEQQKSQTNYILRSGVTLSPAQHVEFNRLLTHLLQAAPATFIMLADAAGQVILAKGEHHDIDLVMLGSLVAGDLAASQEIARLTGEYQDYQIILREGQRSNSFIAEAGPYLALLVQVNRDIPLGWARMLILKTSRQLTDIMAQSIPTAEDEIAGKQEIVMELDETDDSLADLFGDALDDMWGE